MRAKLVVMPLKSRSGYNQHKAVHDHAYIQEAALSPSGKAAAVNRTLNSQDKYAFLTMIQHTEANSYDLAFHVDSK